MTINQYLIIKGAEIIPPNPNSRRANENAKDLNYRTSAAQVLKIAIRWYILPKFSVYLRRIGICLTLDLSCGMFCAMVVQS